MGRKKKKIHKKPVSARHQKQIPAVPGTVNKAAEAGKLLIGIIGWNSRQFVQNHSEFVESLKKSIDSHGGQAVFYPISGGSDHLPLNHQVGSDAALMRQMFQKKAGDNDANHQRNWISHYWLPSRDIVADQIEILAHEEGLNGVLMIPWSVSSLVGMLMATVRCGIPTLFLPQYQLWPVFSRSDEQLRKKNEGVSVPYSLCSMLVLLEVLGLARMGVFGRLFCKEKKGDSILPSGKSGSDLLDSDEIAEWGGQRIIDIAKQKLSSRRFFSQASFHNAMCVDMALGGAPDTVLHLSAVAQEAGVPLPRSFFNEGAKKVLQLVPANRSGELEMDELEKCGGLKSLLGALHSLLQASPTVTGKNIIEIARENDSPRSSFKITRSYKKHGGLAVLFGNLAPEGALFRVAGLKDQWLANFAAVKVFDSEMSCVEAILSKKVKKGDAVVIRYCGPKGSPGMPYLRVVKCAIEERGLEDSIVVISDGRVLLSGKTPALVHVAPEAANGSALSVLQDGDVVHWNFFERTVSVRLTDTEIKVRLSRWKEQEKNMRNGFLYRYSKYTSSSSFGATLV